MTERAWSLLIICPLANVFQPQTFRYASSLFSAFLKAFIARQRAIWQQGQVQFSVLVVAKHSSHDRHPFTMQGGGKHPGFFGWI